jgi:hypothetical protein
MKTAWTSICGGLVLMTGLALAPAVQAGPAADELAKCFGDNTSGKDRKDLARWIFLAMAAHPEMRDLTKFPDSVPEASSANLGRLFTRLISESCPGQVQTLIRTEGGQALRIGFEFLGRLAMQELMSNPDVTVAVSGFERYVDRAKVGPVLEAK